MVIMIMTMMMMMILFGNIDKVGKWQMTGWFLLVTRRLSSWGNVFNYVLFSIMMMIVLKVNGNSDKVGVL